MTPLAYVGAASVGLFALGVGLAFGGCAYARKRWRKWL